MDPKKEPDTPENPDRIIPEHIDISDPQGDHAGTIYFTENPLIWVFDFGRAKGGRPGKEIPH